jgi:hypothetical protein
VRTIRLEVVLREVTPLVRRVIDVPPTITLDELHEVLQVALSWTDSHLHQFGAGTLLYGTALPELDAPEDELDERWVRLSALPSRFVYAYDFGDGWEHDVEVLGPGGEQPGCVDGEGACPPEDCGGPYGYAEMLEALADPANPEHDSMTMWVGDRLRPFDVDLTSVRVREVVGTVPESVGLLLAVVTDGIKLTPGGRLPRWVVREIQAARPAWYPLERPASIEEDLLPLAALHDILRHVGLLRLAKGILRPTKAATDETDTVRRLRSWFEPHEFGTHVAERAVALLEARGPMRTERLAAETFELIGHGWRRGTEPITAKDLERELYRLAHSLTALDLVANTWPEWRAGPSARSLLPGASLLANIL